MRRMMTMIAALMLSVTLCACSAPSSKIALDQHISIEKLSCAVPVEWSKTYGSVETMIYAPNGDTQKAFALLFFSEEGIDLISGLEGVEEWISQQNGSIEIHSSENIEIDSYTAKKLHYSYSNENTPRKTSKSILVDVDGSLAALSLATTSEEFSSKEELFDEILNSISLTKQMNS